MAPAKTRVLRLAILIGWRISEIALAERNDAKLDASSELDRVATVDTHHRLHSSTTIADALNLSIAFPIDCQSRDVPEIGNLELENHPASQQ